jgi:mono/diheme cytochrome c family protein
MAAAMAPQRRAFGNPDARTALAGTGAAIGAAIVGLTWRRGRWFAGAAAAILLALGLPRLGLLLVPAYPTSYLASPTEFAATSIDAGARLFVSQCAACHGAQGHGNGPVEASLPVRPADLTAEHVQMHRDGDLYWFIAHGFTAPDGTAVMPGFAPALSTDAIWHLVDYLRAHNAGEAVRRTGRWPQPVPMPQFDAICVDGRTIDLEELRGRAIRIVAGSEPAPSELDAVTVLVSRGATSPTDDACVAAEPQVWSALAILVGASADALPGTQVLVDANGWLRAVSRPGTSIQIGQARAIFAHPLPINAAGLIGHHH